MYSVGLGGMKFGQNSGGEVISGRLSRSLLSFILPLGASRAARTAAFVSETEEGEGGRNRSHLCKSAFFLAKWSNFVAAHAHKSPSTSSVSDKRSEMGTSK